MGFMVRNFEIGIFVINLDRSASRMRSMERQLSSFNLNFTRIRAVDGDRDDITSEMASAGLKLGEVNGRPLGPREIGCYLSHIKAYRAMKRANLEAACILEDDVELGANFPLALRCLSQHCTDNIVAKLEPWPKPRLGVIIGRAGDHRTIYSPQGLIETGAYFVTQTAIDAMPDLQTITEPFDHALFADRQTGPLVVTVSPAAARQSDRFQSLIKVDRELGRATQRRIPRLQRELCRPFIQLFEFVRAIVRVYERLGIKAVLDLRYRRVLTGAVPAAGGAISRAARPSWPPRIGAQPAFRGDRL